MLNSQIVSQCILKDYISEIKIINDYKKMKNLLKAKIILIILVRI